MQRKPLFWATVSLLCFAGALFFWQKGDQRQAEKNAAQRPVISSATNASHATASPSSAVVPIFAAKTPPTALAKNPYPYRLKNTDEPLARLVHNDKAILLANALLDTSKPLNLSIPDRLRAPVNNGSYVVQANGLLTDQFRALLRNANATIVSYIPNNAYLVRVSDAGAQQIASNPQTQSVLPYQPYYKLDAPLLKLVMENPQALPAAGSLNVTLFPDAGPDAIRQLQSMGVVIDSQQPSPFGPLLKVDAPAAALPAIAGLPIVQQVAAWHTRKPANDLDRVRLGVATDGTTNGNYLGLDGTGVTVNINDTGADAMHPDLVDRIAGDVPSILMDFNGHGTHVTGTILGSGAQSSTVATNPPGSGTNFNFRGMAPKALAFEMSFLDDDAYLQETAAKRRGHILISNNSWNVDDSAYDILSASYDAAVRDALPETQGSQPILYVFAAGDVGGGFDDGTGGLTDTILSPATAKNVITVGAIEEPRMITNDVVVDGVTNSEILNATDSDNEVASFSSRGNVGINVEGGFGRYKPDVVAPGTFIISDRSEQWDTNAYYSAVHTNFTTFAAQSIPTNTSTPYIFPVPFGTFGITITLRTNASTVGGTVPNLPIYVAFNNLPPVSGTPEGTNLVTLPDRNFPVINSGDTLFFVVSNTSPGTVNFDVQIEALNTNDVGNIFSVLQTLNAGVGPWYRYESGTSMAAAGVSGMLALMQQFLNNQGISPSPALMKALLINGSRSLSDQYNFITQNSATPNSQGWGLPNLPTVIPGEMTNGANSPVVFFDQDSNAALATGQSATRTVTLSSAAQLQDLRFTLVWTDPPGNPAASVKLVNDLDLIVTNMDTGEVFYGNDFQVDAPFSEATTNNSPIIDSINNVKNVFLQGPLDNTNLGYSVTVLARRVNVNAVTSNNTAIVQDYALVISSGTAGSVTNPFSSITLATASNSSSVTNFQVLSNGVPYFNQRVGANSQYSLSTNGTSSQWNFYVYTNSLSATNVNFTNVAFITFSPPNLGLPRMGASQEINPPDPQATRFAGADIDLYVSGDPALTNLNPTAVAAAFKGVGRTGNETVFFTNSLPGQVYYIAVKSEDQQAAQYGFVGFATDVPFSSTDGNGNQVVNMYPAPLNILGGSSLQPSTNLMFGICIGQSMIRKVVVTNDVSATDFGDYIGALSMSTSTNTVVLNNHNFFTNGANAEVLVYDDSGENNIPNSQPSAGPGSLQGFTGLQAQGSAWFFTMVNDSSSSDTGTINHMTISLEPQPPASGFTETISGDSFFFDFIDIPANATNFTITVVNDTLPIGGPLNIYVKQGDFPSFSSFDETEQLSSIGGSISVNKFSNPPLNAGRYFFGIFNPNLTPQTVTISIEVDLSLAPIQQNNFLSIGNEAIADDAVTYSTNHVGRDSLVVSADVGVRIIHPRESDLVLTLISPSGTRVLLAENRGILPNGTLDTNGYGSGFNVTNTAPTAASGGVSANTNTIPTLSNFGTLLINYNFFTVPDDMQVVYDGVPIFDSGLLSGAGTFSVNFGPGISTNIDIIMNTPGSNPFGTAGDLWTYTASIITQDISYATFTENTNLTTTPIKFAPPPFGSTNAFIPPLTNFSSGFETNTATNYFAPSIVEGWSILTTNFVTVITDPATADTGTNFLALHGAGIYRVMPTVAGNSYTLIFADRETNGVPVTAQEIISATTSLTGGTTNPISALNQWTTNVFTFVAPSNNMVLTILADTNTDGMLLDSFILIQNAQPNPTNYFLPEESLAKLVGESSLGDWRLEVLDNRIGPANATNILVSWELSLILADKVPLSLPLTMGVPATNTVPPGGTLYFAVDVPVWAISATNTLTSISGQMLNLVFSQTNQPSAQTSVPLFSTSAMNSDVLLPGGNPPLLAGETYFLGVQNPSLTTPANFTIQVDFGIPVLTNFVPVTNSVPATPQPLYYQFNVPANSFVAEFDVFNTSGNVILVVSSNSPPPTLATANYFGMPNPGTNRQSVVVFSNSTPPLTAGTWFVGVYTNPTNTTPVNVTILASASGLPLITPLTNGLAITNTATAGPSLLTNFYSFTVTNANAVGALFELYQLNGNVDLTANQSNNLAPGFGLPYAPPPPFLGSSTNLGTSIEQIVVSSNAMNNLTNGYTFYLGVPNNDPSNVTYTIRATVTTNGVLQSVIPISTHIPPFNPAGPTGPTLVFTTTIGNCYAAQYATSLVAPIIWTDLPGSPFTAASTSSSATDPTPVGATTGRFYRIVQTVCP